MGRTSLFRQFARTLRTALYCEREGISTAEGLERRAKIEDAVRERASSRREFLSMAGKAALVGAVASQVGVRRAFAAPRNNAGRVGIVGAGLGGLVCGDRLLRGGVRASIFDAN